MSTRPQSAEAIRQIIIGRIRAGQYAVGGRIPASRVLADELGVHRNTVGKALQELARDGLISLTPGRGGGAYVLQDVGGGALASEQIAAELEALARRALHLGVSSAQLLELAQAAVTATYHDQRPRLKFLECNFHDSQLLTNQLARLADAPIEVGVIDEEDLPALGEQYDLVITTFHHLAEISAALGPRRSKVVGVNAIPTTEVSLAIARLESQRLGLVCSRKTTVQSIRYLVASYHPDDELTVALTDDPASVVALAQTSETLIVTHSAAEDVVRLSGRQPDIVVEFQIEAQSIDYVRRSIARLQEGLSAGRPPEAAAHGPAGR